MSLFSENPLLTPLALRMAPRDFTEYMGQEALTGEGGIIRSMVEKETVQSMVFYGPPASGKTGLARIIASNLDAEFVSVNALTLNSDDIRKVLAQAGAVRQTGGRTVLFVDEIHRLTRPKQDAFLSALETGTIILIGATTENPYFSLQAALRSRLLIFEFFPLSDADMKKILSRALHEDVILKELNLTVEPDAEEFLIQQSSDPRRMLGILDAVASYKKTDASAVAKKDIETILQKTDTVYGSADAHYDVISAFIKSIRGSDPDAALYYLGVMIESGEDPRFIFRRLLISAVEDIGMAYPEAVSVVLACAESFEYVGYPEGVLHLSHATLFLAGLPKSNTVLSIYKAQSDIRAGKMMKIPKYLRSAGYFMKSSMSANARKISELAGADNKEKSDYLYPHNFPGHFVHQNYTEKRVSYYTPSDQGFEKKIKERLENLWGQRFTSKKPYDPHNFR